MKIKDKIIYWINRGKKLYNAKQYDLAKEFFFRVKEVDKDNAESDYYLGLIYMAIKDFDNASIYLERVLKSRLSFLHIEQVHMLLGYIYVVREMFDIATYHINSALDLNFNNPQAYSLLGYIAYKQGQIDEAIELYNKALDIDPDNENALNSLGYIYVETGKDIYKGIDLIKKALSKNPSNPAYLDSLAWAYYKKGDIILARTNIKRAASLLPKNKTIKKHLRKILGIIS